MPIVEIGVPLTTFGVAIVALAFAGEMNHFIRSACICLSILSAAFVVFGVADCYLIGQ